MRTKQKSIRARNTFRRVRKEAWEASRRMQDYEVRLTRLEAQVHSSGFLVPTRARKIGGSFEAEGTIISWFRTTSGKVRVVFEFDTPKGMLHIYSPEQLVPIATP